MTPNAPPSSTDTLTEAPPNAPSPSPSTIDRKARSLANLKRYPKGTRPEAFQRENKPSRKALDQEIQAVLQASSGASMTLLAQKIVQGALELNPVACSFLFPRLWPIVKDQQEGQRVVFEGIRLELTPTGGACVTVARKEEGETNTTDTLSVEQGTAESDPPGLGSSG